MLSDLDEFHHTPDDQPDWQESWYFNWFAGALFGLVRIGYRPTRFGWSCDALLLATEHGQPARAFARIGVPLRHRHDPHQGLTIGRFSVQMVEPYRRFRISVYNLCALEWEALAPPHDFGEGEGPPGIAPRHFEQCGAVTGWFKLHGERRQVAGLGQRDKSWGQRSWSNVAGWDWLCVPVSAQVGLHLWSATGTGRRQYGGGFLRRGTRLTGVDLLAPTLTTTASGQPLTLSIYGRADNQDFRLTGKPVGIFPLAKSGLWLDETAMDYTLAFAGEQYACRGLWEHAYHVGVSGYLRRLPTILKTLTVLRP